MGYKALARKWRPKNFDEVMGQNETVAVLKNALVSERVHHAYLFTGTRGVGKTTMARIFAKALNCEKGVTSEPCGKCFSCQGIDNNNMVDLIEVDAASRTKVEETRELLDNVQYAPTQGRFKIYLIDEIHMFSKHSFNALLKTLEEPPGHVKFLLATTDHEKIPATVLSRCLKLNLKKISNKSLIDYIEQVLKGEGVSSSKEAIKIIAESADGSARDALSLLDRMIVLSDGSIKTTDVSNLLGIIDKTIVMKIFELIADNNQTAVFKLARELAELAPNYELILDQMLSFLKKVAVFQLTKDTSQLAEDKDRVIMLSEKISPELSQLFFEICLLSKRNLIYAVESYVVFEIMLVRLLTFHCDTKMEPNLQTRDETLAFDSSVDDATPVATSPSADAKKKNNEDPAPSKLIDGLNWLDVVEQLGLEGLPGELVNSAEMMEFKNNNIFLKISSKHQHLNQKTYIDQIEKKLSRVFEGTFKVMVNLDASTSDVNSPTYQKEASKEANTKKEKDRLLSKSQVRDLQKEFDAKLRDIKLTEEE